MSFWGKLKSLFVKSASECIKEQQEEAKEHIIEEPEAVEKEITPEEEKPIEKEEVKEEEIPVSEPIIPVEPEEPSIEEEEAQPEEKEEEESEVIGELDAPDFIVISEEERIQILNTIRPVIKAINSDEKYLEKCKEYGATKVLKLYNSISEDNYFLYLEFTQNREFTRFICDFVSGYIIVKIIDAMEEAFAHIYSIGFENDKVEIYKVNK